MRVIVTGGSGLIGRALTASLVSDGHEVIILSRTPDKVRGLPDGARAEGWDARTAEGWASLADGADAIVNMAGYSLGGEAFFPARWTARRRQLIRESRQNAGRAVVEAVKAASRKPGVVVQSSAIGYYGPQGDATLTEDSPSADDFLSRVTVDWEAATAPVEDMGVRRVVTRTGLLLSAEGGALTRLLLPFKLFVGGPMGSGRQWYSWIHMADEIRAVRFLIENEQAQGVFNLTAPNPVTNRELARAIGRVMRRTSFVPVPAFGLKLAFGEVTTVVLDGQRVLPKRLQDSGFAFRFTDVEAALRDLLT